MVMKLLSAVFVFVASVFSASYSCSAASGCTELRHLL